MGHSVERMLTLCSDGPLTFLWYGQICVPVAVAIQEDYCMALANMQVSEFPPMGLLIKFLISTHNDTFSLKELLSTDLAKSYTFHMQRC